MSDNRQDAWYGFDWQPLKSIAELTVLFVFMIWGVSGLFTTEEAPLFMETFSTPQGQFNVVYNWLEYECKNIRVQKAATMTAVEQAGYVYGPNPGVPCYSENPWIHHAHVTCKDFGNCLVQPFTDREWDALRTARETTPRDERNHRLIL